MITNSAVTSPSLAGSLDLFFNSKINSMRFCTFAKVVSVNRDKKTINAQPLVAEAVNQKSGKKAYKQLPIIQNVPYFVGHTPQEGEDCILIHLDRGIAGKKIKNQNEAIVKNAGVGHTLSNCVAICGFVNPHHTFSESSNDVAENSVEQENNELLSKKQDKAELLWKGALLGTGQGLVSNYADYRFILFHCNMGNATKAGTVVTMAIDSTLSEQSVGYASTNFNNDVTAMIYGIIIKRTGKYFSIEKTGYFNNSFGWIDRNTNDYAGAYGVRKIYGIK